MQKFLLITLLLCGAAFGLSYLKEIDRLERDEDPTSSGRRLILIAFCSLGLSFLFTLLSADAGIIMLTLSVLLLTILSGVTAGQWYAWRVYCHRNPDLLEEE